jgi:hypothetical protein
MKRKPSIAVVSLALAAMLVVAASAQPTPKPDKSPEPGAKPPPPPPGPGGSRDRGGPPSRRASKPLTAEQEKEVLEHLEKKQPEIYKQLLVHREKDRSRYHRTLRFVWYSLERQKLLPEDVRNAYDVLHGARVKMWGLAKELEKAKDPAARDDLEKRLREQAVEFFQAEQTTREHRLKQLEDQIKRLKEDLKERLRNRATVVKEIVERMKGEAARYGRPRTHSPDGGPTTRPSGGPPGRGPKRPSGKRDKPQRDD